jgi:hypothetical protein
MENKKPSITKITTYIEKEIGRKLTLDETKTITYKISSVDYSTLSKPTANAIVDKIIAIFIKDLKKNKKESMQNTNGQISSPTSLVIDMKEFQIQQQADIDKEDPFNPVKNIINDVSNLNSSINHNKHYDPSSINNASVTTLFGISSPYKLQLLINPKSLYKSEYMVLDSKNRDFVPTQPTLMKWRYSAGGQYSQGVITTVDKLRDIVGMRIQTILTRNTYRYLFSCPLYTLQIQEFAAQSFVAHDDWRFHFAFRPTYDTRQSTDIISSLYSVLKPLNDGYYWFEKPITEVNSFTVSIANPLVPVILPITNVVVPSSAFSVSNPVTIDISSHPEVPLRSFTYFAVGDLVRIVGFNTANPIADAAVIAQINDSAGHIITSASDTSITIAVDTSTITPLTDNSNPATIINETIRIIIPLEIIYIESSAD